MKHYNDLIKKIDAKRGERRKGEMFVYTKTRTNSLVYTGWGGGLTQSEPHDQKRNRQKKGGYRRGGNKKDICCYTRVGGGGGHNKKGTSWGGVGGSPRFGFWPKAASTMGCGLAKNSLEIQ